jgi:hypothetical protein
MGYLNKENIMTYCFDPTEKHTMYLIFKDSNLYRIKLKREGECEH